MLLNLENESKEGKLARNAKLLDYVFLPPHAHTKKHHHLFKQSLQTKLQIFKSLKKID